MKSVIFVIGLTILAVTSAQRGRSQGWSPEGTGHTIPRNSHQFGGYRFRRSPNLADNSFSGTWSKPLSGPERRPPYNLDYKYYFGDKNGGSVSAILGGKKLPGQRPEPIVAIQDELRFRRYANPDNSFSENQSVLWLVAKNHLDSDLNPPLEFRVNGDSEEAQISKALAFRAKSLM